MKEPDALWISPHADRRVTNSGMQELSVMSTNCSQNAPSKYTAGLSPTLYIESGNTLLSLPTSNLSNGVDPTKATFIGGNC